MPPLQPPVGVLPNRAHLKLAAIAMLLAAADLAAQDIEPRRWTPIPIGTTVAGAAVARGSGDVAFDPVLRLEDVRREVTTTLVSVVHAFDLFGRTARFDVLLPHQHARWEGRLGGEPRTADRRGPADPRLRLSVLLLGAPALRGQEFLAYRAARAVNTVVGAALALTLPLGEYQEDKLLNLGQYRFVIQPQFGLVHTRGPWSYELTGSISFFADNREFLVDQTRAQDPVLLLQTHVVYSDPRGWWLSAGAAYDWGGASTIDGVAKGDYREDLFYGGAVGLSLDRSTSVQLTYVANRAETEIGSYTDNLALGVSVRF